MSKSTQTTLSIDKETKNLAASRAKKNGMSVSVVARIFLRDYATGKLDIGSRSVERDENGFTPQASGKLTQALEDVKNKRNLSPGFDNSKNAIEWLHKQND
ncbi:MAG: hypothetical protein WC843_05265 [Candidatus Gracilibacteria bacterium]|jgi:antitoxin component of RelBE/YafQ-DinJ toxin-antitoxin module